jgi:hypothetical protein
MKVTTIKGLEKKMLRELNYRIIDHLEIVEGKLFAFPYQSHKDDLKTLIEYCDKNGIDFLVYARSSYGAGTHSIEFALK